MNRFEREDLIERLETENAETLADSAERKARRLAGQEPREWQTPEPGPVAKPQATVQPMDEKATITRNEVVRLVEALGDELGSYGGNAARAQDEKIKDLEERLRTLEGLLMSKGINVIELRGHDAA